MKQFQEIEMWAQMQWENSDLGDKRRNERAIKLALSLLAKPHESLPYQIKNWADLKAAYRLLGSKDINHHKLQKTHWENTAKKVLDSQNTVLFLQDTSDLDYSSKKSIKNLGYIGNHKGTGLIFHSCLAVKFDKEVIDVLGLMHQQVWTRNNTSYRTKETTRQRKSRDHEGKIWEKSLIEISQIIDPNQKIVTIGDRGSDIFTYMFYCKSNNWNYVIRAKHNRMIVQNNQKEKLFNWIRLSSSKAKKIINIRNEKIELDVTWEQINIAIPKHHQNSDYKKGLTIWAVRCWNNEKKIDWILLTNLAINNQSEAFEIIDWYSARWLIEEYHKCLKTGCGIEKRNLRTADGLKNILGFLGIIATQLLKIKFFTRINQNALANSFIDKLPLKIICFKFKLQVATITIKKFWHSVARIGGFIGRNSDGDPGWQTLWKGWIYLSDLVRTLESLKKCG